MSDDLMYWCRLKNGDKETIGFIEERGAKIGSLVEMVDIDGEFWEVTHVGYSQPKSEVRQNERRFKNFQGSLRGGGIDS